MVCISVMEIDDSSGILGLVFYEAGVSGPSPLYLWVLSCLPREENKTQKNENISKILGNWKDIVISFSLGSIHTGDSEFDKAVSCVNTLIINISVIQYERKSLLLPHYVKTPIDGNVPYYLS